MREALAAKKFLAENFCDPAQHARRCRNADLLAHNASRGQFECVPTSGQTHSRSGTNPLRHQRIGVQRSRDIAPIRVQIKHGANSLNNLKQRARIAKLNTHGQRFLAFVQCDFKVSLLPTQRNGPAVHVRVYDFHPRNRALRQECQHAFPVVRLRLCVFSPPDPRDLVVAHDRRGGHFMRAPGVFVHESADVELATLLVGIKT